MDVFAEHGIAGMVGLIFNALFGTDAIVGLDGVNVGATNETTNTPVGGWLIHNYRQLYIQLAFIVAASAYSFVVSALIAYAINLIPGLNLRASEEAELLGMDDDQLGEFAYDYVEVRRDYLAWNPRALDPGSDSTNNTSRADLYGCGEHNDMLTKPVQKPQPLPKEYVISPSKMSSLSNLQDGPPQPVPENDSVETAVPPPASLKPQKPTEEITEFSIENKENTQQ